MTLSPRRATGHTEPTYDKRIDCKIVDNANPETNDQVELGIMCHNATQWSNPVLDLTSKTAPFMFAVGPETFNNGSSWSNSPQKDLRIHSAVGQFTMDMTTATVSSNIGMVIPSIGNVTQGASASGQIKVTRNLKTAGHGIAMIIAIILLIPLDSVIRLCLKSTRVHMIMMGLVTIVFSIGSGVGFAVSGMFNRSKNYNSAHQIIGLLVFVMFFSQIPLGWITMGRLKARASADQIALADDPHYNPPRKTRQPLYSAHMALAGLILGFTLIDGGLGFKFALGPSVTLWYILLVTGVFIMWLGVFGIRWMWNKKSQDTKEEEDHERKTQAAIQHYQMQAFQAQQQGGAPTQPGQYPSVSIPRTY
jgi:hypothetical protein